MAWNHLQEWEISYLFCLSTPLEWATMHVRASKIIDGRVSPPRLLIIRVVKHFWGLQLFAGASFDHENALKTLQVIHIKRKPRWFDLKC